MRLIIEESCAETQNAEVLTFFSSGKTALFFLVLIQECTPLLLRKAPDGTWLKIWGATFSQNKLATIFYALDNSDCLNLINGSRPVSEVSAYFE